MVVSSDKIRARAEFGRLLRAELIRKGFQDGRGLVAAVHRQLKDGKGRPLVSYEQVRKWITGKDIPEQAHFRIACERLGLAWGRLHPGATDAAEETAPDPMLEEFLVLWHALDEKRREHILASARLISGGPPPDGPAPRVPQRSDRDRLSSSSDQTYSVANRKQRRIKTSE